MGEKNISSSVASDLTNAVTDYSVAPREIDSAGAEKETKWENTNWTQWLAYYKEIPELGSVIDAKATWTVGKGYKAGTTDPETGEFKADKRTEKMLMEIRGWGKDTFNTILENMIRDYHIGGDAFAEIIRKGKKVINLKPLNPGKMVIVVDKLGMLKGYEQKTGEGKVIKFKPEDIFHLARNRTADEIHGISITEKLVNIILMRNEAMADYKQVMHRFVKPRWIIKLNTDDTTKIATEKAKWDTANEEGENMYIPMGAVEVEQMSIDPKATMSPQKWIEELNNYFYQSAGVPKVIVGEAMGVSEASSKILYLAFQQTIEEEQLFVEEQVFQQLELEIELEFPATIEAGLLSDEKKDAGAEQKIKPSETTASLPGTK